MNKCLALLKNVYDDDHGFKITVTEQNGNTNTLSMHQIILF